MTAASAKQVGAGRIERLRKLMDERGYDALVLRNNPDLRWLTAAESVFDLEVAHVAYVTREGLWLHTDSRYYNALCERLGDATAWQLDMDVILPADWAAQRIAEMHPRTVALEDSITLGFFDALVAACAKGSFAPDFPRMHDDIQGLRMVKDADELELLRQAQRITDQAFEHICGYIKPGMTELQIRAELESCMLSLGANGTSFDTIIAAGPNGANPHAQPGEYAVKEGDLIVMDYGALYHDYHADMTRTVCLGEPSQRQREVYDIVRRAHEECAAMVRAGVNGKAVHDYSVKVISDAGYGDYYGHGLGHGVGIEIHEQPGLGRSWDKPLPAGSVVTVEPGIYLPGEFGIRLEDCGVVTEEGYRPFTGASHELRVIPLR